MCCHKYPHVPVPVSPLCLFTLYWNATRVVDVLMDGFHQTYSLQPLSHFLFFPPSLVPTSVFDPDLEALTRVSVWKPNTRIKRGGRWRSDNAGQCEERGPRANWQQGVKVSLTLLNHMLSRPLHPLWGQSWVSVHTSTRWCVAVRRCGEQRPQSWLKTVKSHRHL